MFLESNMKLQYFVLLFYISVVVGKRFRCDYKYVGRAEGWLKYHEVPANWNEARLRCHLEGGQLASPLQHVKPAMTSLMRSHLNNASCGVFTGIHSYFSRGDYASIEGTPLRKIPHTWARGEPDNFKDQEGCIVMLNDEQGNLADVDCTDTFPYICYKPSASLVVSSCGTTDPGYVLESTGSCYKFHRVPRTWSRAYMACAAEGAHLAIINSQAEAEVIKKLFGQNPGGSMLGNFWKDVAFVGFHDWGEHGGWLTIYGQTLPESGYDKFSGGEPNNATTGEYCGGVYRNGMLDDIWCMNSYAFICEKDPHSLACEQQEEDKNNGNY